MKFFRRYEILIVSLYCKNCKIVVFKKLLWEKDSAEMLRCMYKFEYFPQTYYYSYLKI